MRSNNTLAIEPNTVHVDILRQLGEKWNDTKLEIDPAFFDENYNAAKRYDVISVRTSAKEEHQTRGCQRHRSLRSN